MDPWYRRGIENFVACFLHSSAQMCLYQTPDRRPPPITGRIVNNVTRGWVRAPNGRAPFRFHGAFVVFVDRYLSRTRNLAASNKHLAEFFSGRSWPKIGPKLFFSGFLKGKLTKSGIPGWFLNKIGYLFFRDGARLRNLPVVWDLPCWVEVI